MYTYNRAVTETETNFVTGGISELIYIFIYIYMRFSIIAAKSRFIAP